MFKDPIDVFMEKITIKNKDISKYRDEEKGNALTIPTGQLYPRLESLELTKQELQKLKFEGKIEDLKYEQVEFERPTPKNEITKREEDKYTIVNKKIKGYEVYNVFNGLNVKKSFTKKEDAIKLSDEIDKKVDKFYE